MSTKNIGAYNVTVDADTSKADSAVSRTKQGFRDLTSEVEAGAARQNAAQAKQVQSLEKGVVATNKAKQSVRELTTEIETGSNRQSAAQARQVKSLEKQIATLGLSRAETIKWRISQVQGAEQSERLTKALDKQVAKFEKTGTSAAQYNAAIRTLPAQYTDVATQLAGGANPALVLFQQLGQARDSFGSLGALLKGIGSSISSIINPVALVVTSVAALGIAAYKGSRETDEFNNALIESGNSAGLTGQQLSDLAGQLGQMSGTTAAGAADALLSVAASGAFTADQFKVVATAALEWKIATGAAVEETVKQFEKLAEDPVKAVVELSTATGGLTEAQVKSIQTLEEQGKHTEAVTLAINTQAEVLHTRGGEMVQNLGILEKAWRGVKNAVSVVADAAMSVGRGKSSTAQLAAQANALLEADQKVANARTDIEKKAAREEAAAAERRLSSMRKQLSQSSAQGTSAEERRAIAANVKLREENYKAEQAAAAKSESLAERLEAVRTKAARDGVTDREAITKAETLAREQYEEEQARKRPKKPPTSLGSLQSDDQKAQAQREKQALDDQTKELKEQYSARTLSANDYYNKLRENAAAANQVEVNSINQQIAALAALGTSRGTAEGRQEKAKALQEELLRLQESRASKIRSITAAERADTQKRQAAMESYKRALEETTVSMELQFQSAISRVGSGEREFEIESKVNEVLAEKAARLREIALARSTGQMPDDVAASNENAINSESEKRVSVIRKGYDDLKAAEGDWRNGMRSGFQNYIDEAGNTADQMQNLFSGSMKGIEDAFVQATQTGKLSFKDLTQSILADISRIMIRKAIAGIVGSVVGGGAGATGSSGLGFASGGYTGHGGKYVPAGIVHRGEVVFSQDDVRRHGGVLATEKLRRFGGGYRGYAEGGIVGSPVVNNNLNMMNQQSSPNVNIQIIGGSGDARTEQERKPNGDLDIRVFMEQTERSIAGRIGSGQSPLLPALKGRLNVEDRK